MTTTNLGMTVPTVGADTDTWGGELNADLALLDAFAGTLMGAAEVSIASAATVDIGNAASTAVNITGNTGPITSFGTKASCIRFVRYASNPSLTYNATSMILIGGATRQINAGDRGIYKSDGSGNWTEIAFSRAGGQVNRTFNGAISDITGVIFTTYAMGGLAIAITPKITGKIRFFVSGGTNNDTAGSDNFMLGRYGTGTAPLFGSGPAGNTMSTNARRVSISAPSSGYISDITYYGEATGLTLGTAYWVDVALKVSAGTGAFTDLIAYVEEIPG